MREYPTFGERIFDVFNVIALSLLMLVTLYPIYYVAISSISNPTELMAHKGMIWVPQGLSLKAYSMVFDNPMILKGYGNTLFIVIVGLLFNLTLTAFGAYALSRKGLYYRKQLTLFIIFTMFFSGGLIPYYLTVKGLGLTNTVWALIIPQAINTFNLIIMRTTFQAIPDSLEESAKIDGANDFVILFRIIIPISLPIMAVMILYYGVSHWNSWFNAMIFLRNRELFPLQLILREILISGETAGMVTGAESGDMVMLAETLKYATIMIATLPILFVYPFLQKYFVKGALLGAIKG
ncbi:carbohydrate ABC transporter permease [Paenibacillus radicis (ex Xue et al. 2023)]|uniref:Carbohydrate ABC transporter permease n=1 Tax=Paenibacillus radicis (ex Xue et al. 2023) TaxID=2972489 RepID=A0ABT1YTF0_9BACL|nr:carbohydrate ABC transporter permease [Paenibacillus radicis (ex Xue et al. 2023)]MCR8636458.1 carbohydrate ABC transporter permease [Paenibacillus radicis (ex Xue et al. 2023)]